MSDSNGDRWDVSRFFKTLDDFGEIPFIGSFRWLQQMMGKRTSFPGIDMEIVKKRVVVLFSSDDEVARGELGLGQPDSAESAQTHTLQSFCQKQLQTQLGDSVRFTFETVPDQSGTQDRLADLVGSTDLTIVLGLSALSTLLRCCEDNVSKTPDFVLRPVFTFGESMESVEAWGVLDDVVMGGVSQSRIVLNEREQAVFSGVVSTENSGGFASVRTKNFEPPFNFSGWEGLRLVVKGDGQRYKFILRNSKEWDSPAYIYSFDTVADTWTTVNVPFTEMVRTFRAKSIPDAPQLETSRVYSFQLMLSKFEYDQRLNPQFEAGPFSLTMSHVSVYRARPGVPLVVVANKPDSTEEWQSTLSQVNYHWLDLGDQPSLYAIETMLPHKIAQILAI